MTTLLMDAYCRVHNSPKNRCAVVSSLTKTQEQYYETLTPLHKKCYEVYRGAVSFFKRTAVEIPEVKRFERTAITQEDAADIVANGLPEGMRNLKWFQLTKEDGRAFGRMSGSGFKEYRYMDPGENEKPRGRYPEEHYIMDGLYDSISALVYQLCRKYTATCTTDLEDLAHECLHRIFAKIHQFNRLKGKFTTWTYRVCSSVLARLYHNDKKRDSRFVHDGEDEEKNERLRTKGVRQQGVTVLNAEVREVVRGLLEEYPEKAEFVIELFGNINNKNHLFPVSVCISESARRVGIEYVEAYAFFKRVVRPKFKDYFNREVSNV